MPQLPNTDASHETKTPITDALQAVRSAPLGFPYDENDPDEQLSERDAGYDSGLAKAIEVVRQAELAFLTAQRVERQRVVEVGCEMQREECAKDGALAAHKMERGLWTQAHVMGAIRKAPTPSLEQIEARMQEGKL